MSVWNLYEILDVPRSASTSAIKAAFRKRAKTAHPDVGGDAEAFRLLKLAADVLSDPDKRRHYDETGAVPESQEDILEADLRFAIGEILLSILPQIKSPNFDDVLAHMREAVAQRLADLDNRIALLGVSIEKLAVIASRIQVDNGDNLLRTVASGRRDDLIREREEMLRIRARCHDMQEFLGHYRYFTQIENVLISTDVWRPSGGSF